MKKKCCVLKYRDWVVAISTKRDLIAAYLFQKGYGGLAYTGLTITHMEHSDAQGVYPAFELYEYEGFVINDADRMALDQRIGEDELLFNGLIKDLETAKGMIGKGKSSKKIDKAINAIKKNKDKFKGKTHKIELLEFIVSVPIETLVEEALMMDAYELAMYK